MRGRILGLLACAALAQAGCGAAEPPAAAGYTCGQMREQPGAFREQAAVLVDRGELRAHRLYREEAILDAELRLRRACEGAPDAARPAGAISGARADGLLSPGAAR